MKKETKKYIIWGVVAAAVVGFLAYWSLFRKKGSSQPSAADLLSGAGGETGGSPAAFDTDSVKLSKIITGAVNESEAGIQINTIAGPYVLAPGERIANLSDTDVQGWKEWVNTVFTARYPGRTAAQVVKNQIDIIKITPTWMDGIIEISSYSGIPISENIVWAAILAAVESKGVCIKDSIDYPVLTPSGRLPNLCSSQDDTPADWPSGGSGTLDGGNTPIDRA